MIIEKNGDSTFIKGTDKVEKRLINILNRYFINNEKDISNCIESIINESVIRIKEEFINNGILSNSETNLSTFTKTITWTSGSNYMEKTIAFTDNEFSNIPIITVKKNDNSNYFVNIMDVTLTNFKISIYNAKETPIFNSTINIDFYAISTT